MNDCSNASVPLQHFGEITKNVLDPNIPSLIISFAVRSHAEQAMQRGRIFKEKPLQVSGSKVGS